MAASDEAGSGRGREGGRRMPECRKSASQPPDHQMAGSDIAHRPWQARPRWCGAWGARGSRLALLRARLGDAVLELVHPEAALSEVALLGVAQIHGSGLHGFQLRIERVPINREGNLADGVDHRVAALERDIAIMEF